MVPVFPKQKRLFSANRKDRREKYVPGKRKNIQACASAELNLDVTFDENGFISDVEDWYYFGYTYGGVTFVVPTDSYSYPLDDAQKEAGIILVTGNADYTLQLRSFEPEVMTYKDLKQQIKKEITAEVHTEEREGKEVLFYRNKYPTEVSELYGIGLEGLDGKLYKISIFTENHASNWSGRWITTTSTTMDCNNLAFMTFDRFKYFFECIWSMSVVHNYSEWLAFVDYIHATFDRFE